MEVEKNNTTVPGMTPAQQGVFFDLLKKQMPAWMLQAPEDVRTALYKSLKSSYQSRSAVLDELRALKSPEKFCAPLLAQALSAKLVEPVQVEGVVFQHVRSASSLLGLRKKLVLPIARDLLTAACENFEASETDAGNYHERSLIYIPDRITGRGNKLLPIEPHEFAQLCRALDLGKSYQNHLSALFGSKSQVGSLREKSIACAKDQFEVERHLAYMQKHISEDVYKMLKSVSENKSSITLGKNSLGYQRLEMLDIKLHGPMFVGPVTEHKDGDFRCVVYLPGDPLHPLKEYASFSQFEVELSRRLRTPEFRTFFMRYIKLKDRATFLSNLDQRLITVRHPSLHKESVYVQISGFDLDTENKYDVFLAMFQHHAEQVLANARLLVVPTDDEDEKSRLARLDTYQTIGFNAVLFFASFVPVVGEIMFAVAGIQLLTTVYEGIASWAAGEQEQATDYLFETLENLILMAALGVTGKAVSGTYKTIKASDFVLRLREVSISPGVVRLWKSDLSAYREHQTIPHGIRADEQGLISQKNNRYLRIGADHFAVQPTQETDVWEVRHPKQAGSYLPVLETNGAGAWRHDSELPQEWNLLTLFRRLGYREEEVSDVQALQVLAAIGVDENQLHRLFVDRRKPMATLVDTVRRFRADTAVEQFMQALGETTSAPMADADLQLFLLTSTSNWPKDLAVSVVSALGNEITRYGPAKASRPLKIAQDLLHKGQFYPVLLAGLDNPQRTQLLRTASSEQASQVSHLVQLLARQAGRSRLALFNRLDLRTDIARQSMAAPVRKAFAGLPGAVVDELALNADASEWLELEDDKLPLRVAEEARRYQQVVNLNRVYEGLYLDGASDLSTDMVVLDTLGNLPGWPQDVFIEITEWAVPSEDKARLGPADARYKVFIEAFEDRYQAVDADEKVLAKHSSRTRAHYFQTLWQSLPEHARKALGVEADDAGAGLREKITALALQRRELVARLVSKESLRVGYRSPMGLADPRVVRLVSLTQSAPVAEVARSAALARRARELYPLQSPAQIESFLTSLGSDEVVAIRTLEGLRQQYLTIRNTLERWVHRETHYQTGDGPRLAVPAHNKARAAQAILRAWRRESGTAGHPSEMLDNLTFDAQPLGELPALIGDFRHIGVLEMDNVGASAGLNTFLHNFPNLHSLSLTGNGLTRVPQAIDAMSRLTHLDLSNNQIFLTAEAAVSLGAKDHLQWLNLSFNPSLGRMPTVSAMRKLQHLALRGTGISEWPEGLDELLELQTLDLRDNLIETLPEAVFKARQALNHGTNVDGNPLSATSLAAIADYQQAEGASLGVITADYIDPPVAASGSDARGAHWVSGLSLDDVVQMQATWASLSAYPNSRDFFLVLEQLRNTADYTRQHTLLAARVWNVLQAAAEDDSLRSALFRMARIGRVSANEPSGLFSDLEVRVLCYRATEAARTGVQSLEGELVRLLRGLFRLQEVQKQAMIDIGIRVLDDSITRQQALELSLSYRVRLAQRLDLPAQPRAINVQLDVEVTEQQLDKAYKEVAKAENSPALLESINAQSFWSEYLSTTYRGQFVTVLARSAEALAELEAQADLSRATATQRMMAIFENYRNENLTLRKQLTQQALARHPGLAMPAAPTPGRLTKG